MSPLHIRLRKWMQRAIRPTIASIILIVAAPHARAGIVASDYLDYPNGHMGDQSGGFGWTIPWYTASNPEGGWEIVSGEAVTMYVPYSSYTGRWFTNPEATPEPQLDDYFRVST